MTHPAYSTRLSKKKLQVLDVDRSFIRYAKEIRVSFEIFVYSHLFSNPRRRVLDIILFLL